MLSFSSSPTVGIHVTMASEKPGTVQQDDSAFELETSLMSMENMDRSSPELWPEKIPGMSEFMNLLTPPNNNNGKLPYSKEFTSEDENYLHQLASLPTAAVIAKVKELHDMAYQLGLEESKEMTRGKYLNIFSRGRNRK
ncbi:protein lin-52 homolog [Onthophagus taurus]|uniref:protein lin-52 homolog n=1 Tax=Onthophagus taurus TaxID=166361 RepID=UPI000C20584F|nr:protein lin-52 homolog [Onthophagus taurus]